MVSRMVGLLGSTELGVSKMDRYQDLRDPKMDIIAREIMLG